MTISKHIEAAATKFDNTHNIEVLQHIWDNRNTMNFFHINIASVARSGASRKMQAWIPYKNRELDVTSLIADINGYSVSEGVMRVNGGGMDMVFSVLYTLYMAIASKQLKNESMRFKAVNYKRLS